MYTVKLAKRLIADKKEQLKTSEFFVPLFVRDKKVMNEVYAETNQIIFKTTQKYEEKAKDKMLGEFLLDARVNNKVFMLASCHNDCAKDHLEYQGKFYVDARAKLTKEEKKFVLDNNIKPFQWVIGKPVWFITRPNCRHYFKAIKSEEVLSKPIETIIRNHKMHKKVGERDNLQTIRHPLNKGWYTKTNVEDIITKYEERLAYHKGVYKTFKSPTIKRAIEKDILLIKKWKELYQKLT